MSVRCIFPLMAVALVLSACGTGGSGPEFVEFEVNSAFTGTRRPVGVYLPQDYDSHKSYPVIYMEDGLVFKEGEYRHLIDSLILNKVIRPVIVACSYEDKSPVDGYELAVRNAEYVEALAAQDTVLDRMFENHLRYFTDEFVPTIRKKFAVSEKTGESIYYGTSNSADFGLTLSMRHPELFSEYWCFSPVYSDLGKYGMLKQEVSYMICWGAKEEAAISFDYFPSLVQSIRKRGGSVTSWDFNDGHDRGNWQAEFIKLLVKRFPY